MKKKIGIFCGYYVPHLGGVERYTDKLSSALQKLGYEVVIVTSNHDQLAGREVIDGKTVYRLPIHNVAKNRYPIPKVDSEYKDLLRQIRAEGIDYFILNTRFHLTSLVGARLGKRSGKLVLLIEHGTDHFTVGNPLLDRVGLVYEHALTWLLKRYVDGFYGVSRNCAIWLKHFSIRANGVFYNAIDMADQKAVQDYYADRYAKEEVIITYAGRLIKEKGVLNLLDAFMELRRKHPALPLRLVIAGNGDLLKDIQRDYADKSIDVLGKIDFKHVLALFKRTDIFAHPALYPEGLPTVLLEAGLMSCALVATPRGGTEEVIVDGQHGIIVDGSKESLQQAIYELAVDPKKRKTLARNVKSRIERVFNWDTVAEEVDKEITKFNKK